MNGTITYVSPLLKTRRPNSDDYHLITFDLANGSKATFLSPGYKNYPRWKPLMIEGTLLKNLVEKKSGIIDADSAVARA